MTPASTPVAEERSPCTATAAGFWRRPQAVGWRRALFQAHLWLGLAVGLYLILISVSGSAIVFRREMDQALCPRIVMVPASGRPLSSAELTAAAQRVFRRVRRFNPALVQVHGARVSGAAIEVWYALGNRGRLQRLIDPYSGKDLGDAAPCEPTFVAFIADLHDELLTGDTGTAINGAGAAALALMCLTGAILWWPGQSRWRRSLHIHRNVGWRRFIWELHSMAGFWLFGLLAMWAVSALYLTFPNAFYDVRDVLSSHGIGPASGNRLDVAIDWLVRLHFGRSFGTSIEVLWVLLGLAPSVLMVTGTLMWWNRVVRKTMGRSGQKVVQGKAVPSAPP